MADEISSRVQQLEVETAARLRPVCADWSEDVFRAMVKRLAAIIAKYERIL